MAHACCCLKKNRQPCSVEGDRLRGGKWYCHIHDPQGNFQTNNPTQPELKGDDENNVSVETLMRAIENLTLRVESLEHDAAKHRTGDEWKNTPANDDCPFTPNT